MAVYVLIWNPKYDSPSAERWDQRVELIQAEPQESEWGTGQRKHGLAKDDTLFLLEQGDGERGLVARGVARGPVHEGAHWRIDQAGPTNFVPLRWLSAVTASDPLPIETLLREVPSITWNQIYSGGREVQDLEAQATLARLWDRHVATAPPAPIAEPESGRTAAESHRKRVSSRRVGRQLDSAVRSAVEERSLVEAQRYLKAAGWTSIRRLGKPYDLLCTRSGGAELHVEVKGTQGVGAVVELTRNEVAHARTCEQQVALLIVSEIVVAVDGTDVRASGGAIRYWPEWNPAEDALSASRYDYSVPGHES